MWVIVIVNLHKNEIEIVLLRCAYAGVRLQEAPRGEYFLVIG